MPTSVHTPADYDAANAAKATFDDVYASPTPHNYLEAMSALEYCIADTARPYMVAAVELLRAVNGRAWPTQMLDLGCSYGIGATVVKYRSTFAECAAFFQGRAPATPVACAEATRRWLEAVPPPVELRVIGMDTSRPAVAFAQAAGMVAGGITRNFEEETPTEDDLALIRASNLCISTGAVGYVTERTLDPIAGALAVDHPGAFGPLAVLTVLRMFETDAVAAAFESAHLRFGAVPGVRLRQRRFQDAEEQERVLELLTARDIDPTGGERGGHYFADLYVAARPERFDEALAALQAAADA